jgi:hypothetical protein
MAMGMSTDSLLKPQFFGSYALLSAITIAKNETENGTTLNLNPKKLKQAKTKTKNGTTLNLNLKMVDS